MTGAPAIGVVMTAYNSDAFIAQALESLQSQTTPDWQCVVVDDGSTDATADIVQGIADRDHRIRLVRQPNAGVSQARNVGLDALAEGSRYVALLDSDDRYVEDALAAMLALLSTRPDAVGVFGLAEYIDRDGAPVRAGEHPALQRDRRALVRLGLRAIDVGADSTFADLSVNSGIWPAAVGLHRLATVRAVGGFDPAFTRQGDWELYLRMSRLGPFAVLDQQVAWYRRHDDNLTGDVVASRLAREQVRRKAWTAVENTGPQRRTVSRSARRLQLVEGRRMLKQVAQLGRSGRIGPALASVGGAVVIGLNMFKLGPARPSLRRVHWTNTDPVDR